MMNGHKITAKEFAIYLSNNKKKSFKRNNTCECPLAEFLTYKFKKSCATSGLYYRIIGGFKTHKLPLWAERFVKKFDRTYETTNGWTALHILRKVTKKRLV